MGSLRSDRCSGPSLRGSVALFYSLYAVVWFFFPDPLRAARAVWEKGLGHFGEWSLEWCLPVWPWKVWGVGVFSLMRIPVGIRVGPCSLWLASLLQLSPFLGSSVWPIASSLLLLACPLSLCRVFLPFRSTPLHSLCVLGSIWRVLFQLCKAFIRPVLLCGSSGWFLFLCGALRKDLVDFREGACKVVSVCLTSAPILLLVLDSLTSPMQITLNRRRLAFCRRVPSPSCNGFPLMRLASRPVWTRLKRGPSWWSFCPSQVG